MERKKIKKKIYEILSDEFSLFEEPSKGDSLKKLAGGNSVKDLKYPINEEFDIDLSKSDISDCYDVEDLIDLVYKSIHPGAELRGSVSVKVPGLKENNTDKTIYYHYTTDPNYRVIKNNYHIELRRDSRNKKRIFFTDIPPEAFDEALASALFVRDLETKSWEEVISKLKYCIGFRFFKNDLHKIRTLRNNVYYVEEEVEWIREVMIKREPNPYFPNKDLSFGWSVAWSIAKEGIKELKEYLIRVLP